MGLVFIYSFKQFLKDLDLSLGFGYSMLLTSILLSSAHLSCVSAT